MCEHTVQNKVTPLFWRAPTGTGHSPRGQNIPDLLERGCPLWSASNLWSAVSSAAGGSPQSPGTSARTHMQQTARWHRRNSVAMETPQTSLHDMCVFLYGVRRLWLTPVALKSLEDRTRFKIKGKTQKKHKNKQTLFPSRIHAEARAHPAGEARLWHSEFILLFILPSYLSSSPSGSSSWCRGSSFYKIVSGSYFYEASMMFFQ